MADALFVTESGIEADCLPLLTVQNFRAGPYHPIGKYTGYCSIFHLWCNQALHFAATILQKHETGNILAANTMASFRMAVSRSTIVQVVATTTPIFVRW